MNKLHRNGKAFDPDVNNEENEIELEVEVEDDAYTSKTNPSNPIKYIAIIFFIACIIGGIVTGNTYKTVEFQKYSSLFTEEHFNAGLMFLVWVAGFIISVHIYALGEIVSLLNKLIENKEHR